MFKKLALLSKVSFPSKKSVNQRRNNDVIRAESMAYARLFIVNADSISMQEFYVRRGRLIDCSHSRFRPHLMNKNPFGSVPLASKVSHKFPAVSYFLRFQFIMRGILCIVTVPFAWNAPNGGFRRARGLRGSINANNPTDEDGFCRNEWETW